MLLFPTESQPLKLNLSTLDLSVLQLYQEEIDKNSLLATNMASSIFSQESSSFPSQEKFSRLDNIKEEINTGLKSIIILKKLTSKKNPQA